MILEIGIFMLGIGLLVYGAWLLVGGGSKVASVLGVPPVVVGLTVVAFGTSAPELFVSLVAALRGSTGLVLGNVIGSNVANLGLILATAAILRPVIVEKGLPKREVPLLLGATALFTFLVWDGELSRWDSLLLVLGFVAFMVMTLRSGHRESNQEEAGSSLPEGLDPEPPGHKLKQLFGGLGLVILGIVGLAGGGQLIVTSALDLALRLGVSETLIGLTLVAVGTSLPELATTIIAAWKNQDDLALGNIIGSNLFNILAVAGPVGLIHPLVQEGSQGRVQLLCMCLLTALVFVMIVFRGGKIGRGRGWVLALLYTGIMAAWMIQP
ncbi:MAG: calcium/sodium antiporter [Gemmatimonadales bacterium]|nr:calcium/sodium antiporter [Gemmatimonadales bacterium]